MRALEEPNWLASTLKLVLIPEAREVSSKDIDKASCRSIRRSYDVGKGAVVVLLSLAVSEVYTYKNMAFGGRVV